MTVEFTAIGVPQPKGSKTPFVIKGRAVLTDARRGKSRAQYASWKDAVAQAARDWCADHGNPPAIASAVCVDLTFWFPKPKSTPKRIYQHIKKPDVDKTTRFVLDVLSGIIIADDAQVVELVARKRYAIDRAPGCDVKVWLL